MYVKQHLSYHTVETNDKDIDRSESTIIMEIMNINKYYIIIQGPSLIEFFLIVKIKNEL